jgi:hypothetical protein
VSNIKARRKLSDLYRKGVEVRFGPDGGRIAANGSGRFTDSDGHPDPPGEDEVAMWVQPPSPLQREEALREAQAARARALIKVKREQESGEHLTVMAFLADMSDETLLDYVVISEQESRRNEATRDVLGREEWKDIESYRDAMRQFEEMSAEQLENNEEYQAMLELDEKFGRQVQEREKELSEAARESMRMYGRADLEKKAMEKRSEIVGSQAFMKEYERQMMFYAVRDIEDNNELFFESAEELAGQDDQIREVIGDAISPFIADGGEAKNSPRAASGSDSSEPPNTPETSEASTPEDVSA